MRRTLSLLLCLGASSLDAQEGALTELFRARNVEARRSAAAPLVKAGVSFDALYARLRSGRRYTADVETGALDWSREGTGGRHEVVVLVPEDYDPARAYRVCFYLHGGVERRDRPKKGDHWWRRFDRFDGVEQISVFPASWKGSLWWQRSQVENLEAILDRIKLDYHVDENQVFLYGVSDGGSGVFYHAMKAPTVWAAFLPFIGQPAVLSNPATGVQGEMFEANLVNTPLYFVRGESDRLYPADRMLPYVEAFRGLGATVVFRSRAGGHNTRWWNAESPRIDEFMAEHPRDPLPERLVWHTEDAERFGRLHWLVIDELGGGAPSRGLFPHSRPSGSVLVERDGNEVTVTTHGVRRFRLLLSPEEIELDAPIRITTNGVSSFEGRVQASSETLLNWFARDNDRSMLFAAEISVSLEP